MADTNELIAQMLNASYTDYNTSARDVLTSDVVQQAVQEAVQENVQQDIVSEDDLDLSDVISDNPQDHYKQRIKQQEADLAECEKHLIRTERVPGRYIKSFTVNRRELYKYFGYTRFYTNNFSFKPGINLLFGGNGQGKSSLIKYISKFGDLKVNSQKRNDKYILTHCTMEVSTGPAKIYSFCNSDNNARFYNDDTVCDSEFNFVRKWQSLERSEGQTVMQSVCDFLYFMEDDEYVKPDEEAVVLVDEVDSGLDAVACRYLVERIKKIMERKPYLQLFLAFNQYEISKLDTQWINVCTGKIEDTPKSYDEYVERLTKSKNRFHRKVDDEIKR